MKLSERGWGQVSIVLTYLTQLLVFGFLAAFSVDGSADLGLLAATRAVIVNPIWAPNYLVVSVVLLAVGWRWAPHALALWCATLGSVLWGLTGYILTTTTT